MDILYIIGKGCSQCDDQELRYSLRSIDKFGKGVGRVFVAGHCPEWLSSNVVKVPFLQPYSNLQDIEDFMDRLACKHINIIETVLYAVDNTDINDEFLVSMDDHFYVRNVDFDNYPFYLKGKENRELPKSSSSEYGKFMVKTREFLESKGLSIYYLVPHRNMHCSRKIINECRETLEEIIQNKIPVECLCYLLNYWHTKYNIPLTPTSDVKVKSGHDWVRTNSMFTEVFSTGDFKRMSHLNYLVSTLYKEKSKYEE